MALQASGQIRLSNITAEMGIINSNVSLGGLSTHSTLNDQSPYKPNESQPHKMSEFYRYDHNFSSGKFTAIESSGEQSGKWFNFCYSKIEYQFYWFGSKETPQIGDSMFEDNKGAKPLPKGYHFTLAPDPRFNIVVLIGNEGEIIDLNSCEGIEPEDPKGPEPGGPGENPGLEPVDPRAR